MNKNIVQTNKQNNIRIFLAQSPSTLKMAIHKQEVTCFVTGHMTGHDD